MSAHANAALMLASPVWLEIMRVCSFIMGVNTGTLTPRACAMVRDLRMVMAVHAQQPGLSGPLPTCERPVMAVVCARTVDLEPEQSLPVRAVGRNRRKGACTRKKRARSPSSAPPSLCGRVSKKSRMTWHAKKRMTRLKKAATEEAAAHGAVAKRCSGIYMYGRLSGTRCRNYVFAGGDECGVTHVKYVSESDSDSQTEMDSETETDSETE